MIVSNTNSGQLKAFHLLLSSLLIGLTATFLSGSLQAQTLDTIVVVFKPGTSTGYIDSLRKSLNGTQIGLTLPSESRLWKVKCDSLNPCLVSGDTIIDVNEVIKKVSSETKTEGVGKNYQTHIPPVVVNVPMTDNPLPPSIPSLTKCGALPLNISKGTSDKQVTIALIDSGVDSLHTFFKNKKYFHTQSRSFTGSNHFDDQNGHGTHLAGIIRQMDVIGGGSNSFKIMNLQTQNADGSGRVWDAIRAVDWANLKGASIINMSLGYTHDPLLDSIPKLQPLQIAINKANAMKDILIVASAGNDSENIDSVKHYPSAFKSMNLVAVTSDSCSTVFSWFSNFGNVNVDFAAPGQNILGPDLYEAAKPNKWTRKSGTSMAAAIVSGAAGLLATHLASPADGTLKCALLAGTDARGYPVSTAGTLNTEDSRDSLLYGGCALAPRSADETDGSEAALSTPQLLATPVPFSNKLEVRFTAIKAGTAQWWLCNAYGQTVRSGRQSFPEGANEFTIDCQSLQPGFYFLSLEMSGQRRMVQKLIKNE